MTQSRPAALPSPAITCWRCPACRVPLASGARRCPACGAPFLLAERAWNDRRSIYVLLFLVAFQFGLPWLWRSTAFSRPEKAALTFLVFLYFPAVVLVPFYLVHRLMTLVLELAPH
ncbi:MAG: hypothetical protein HZA54_17785 [Planctomycetes bacterium]|nr:hypothetical protein [Planctomycetota bacterium]